MKKFIVKNKKTDKELGRFSTLNDASNAVMEEVKRSNGKSELVLSFNVFDFKVEEINSITTYEEACEYLGQDKYTLDKLSALTMLLVIAEAWNKQDGFVADWTDRKKLKYTPYFNYDEVEKRFVYEYSIYINDVYGSSHLFCFSSLARAEEFGKRFEDLITKLLIGEKQ